jgi:branched-subunit amino acid ABC-type transport system permease component
MNQLLCEGVTAGSIYALVAIGFTKFEFMSSGVNEFVSLDILI